MKGQTVIGINLMTFIKLVVFLGILAIILYSVMTDQNVTKQAIKINDDVSSKPAGCTGCENTNLENSRSCIEDAIECNGRS